MTKVLFIRNGYYPGDPRLKKQVLSLIEKDYSVSVLCLRSKGEKLIDKVNKNLTVYRLPFTHKRSNLLWYFMEYSFSLISFFITTSVIYFLFRYNFIVVHTLPDFLSYSTIIPKIFGSKIVTDFHEPTPELLLTKFHYKENSLFIKLSKFFEQSVISYSDMSIAVTDSLRNRYIERGANPNKIVVISNAVDTDSLKKLSKEIIIKKNHKFLMITHGSIEERYGHEIVIKAIKKLIIEFPNIKYIITGSGTYENYLKNLVDNLNLNDYVEFKGYLGLRDLVKTLKESDLGIIPMYKTPYSELIDTNKMYEYFELGIPVALPKLTPLIKNFSPEEVIFFEPGNTDSFISEISKFIRNQDELKKVSLAAYKKYEKIKWSIEKLKFQKIFEKTLSTNHK